MTKPADPSTSLPGSQMAAREAVEVLTRMRFREQELLLPVGVAYVEEDDLGRAVLTIRLALVDQPVFLPIWDVLVLAGSDPRSLG